MTEKIPGSSDNRLILSAFAKAVVFLGVKFVAVKFSNREL